MYKTYQIISTPAPIIFQLPPCYWPRIFDLESKSKATHSLQEFVLNIGQQLMEIFKPTKLLQQFFGNLDLGIIYGCWKLSFFHDIKILEMLRLNIRSKLESVNTSRPFREHFQTSCFFSHSSDKIPSHWQTNETSVTGAYNTVNAYLKRGGELPGKSD